MIEIEKLEYMLKQLYKLQPEGLFQLGYNQAIEDFSNEFGLEYEKH